MQQRPKEVEILDDFVFVHFQFYRERDSGLVAYEKYYDMFNTEGVEVFDRATYVEYVWLLNTRGNYKIRLTSTGILPEVEAIVPPVNTRSSEDPNSGTKILEAELDLDQYREFQLSGTTPNPRTVYVYRNGYQGRNSFGGKNVAYNTDRLTFVYDFSALDKRDSLFKQKPQACLQRSAEQRVRKLDVRWEKDEIAIVEAFKLRKGDKVRIFWTWNRQAPSTPEFPAVTCDDALK